MKNVSNTVAGLGLAADPEALAAAASNRAGARSSRDMAREATTLIADATSTGQDAAAEAQSAAEEAAAAKAETDKAKAAAAAKAKAAAKARAIAKAHRWVAPVANYTLTSGFGWRWGKLHPAQDLACPTGSSVRALSSGTVIFAGWSTEGYGYMVKIRYWDGTVSWMAHNSRLLVSVGEQVSPGERVAYSGSTGNSTGPHVHLEIHPDNGSAIPPRPWLASRGVYL